MVVGHRATSCSYQLDQQLRIVSLGPGWDEFALENGAVELVSPHPVGRPLFMYVTDATTVHLYELLFKRVMDLKRPVTVPIRCDGPTVRRFMNLTIHVRSQGFLVTTTLARAESRPRLDVLAPKTPRTDHTLAICGWCNRAHVDRRWMEVEDAVAVLRLFERPRPPRVAHGICDACHRFMLAMLADDEPIRPSN
jgi:hypothetical protein